MTRRHYYSVPALAVASLFGGPIASVAFATLEARGLGRLDHDLPWLAGGLIAVLIAALAAAHWGLLDRPLHDLGTQHLPTWEQLAYRLVALAYCAGYWWLHRRERQALAEAGVAPLPGYGAGVLALIIGLVGGTTLLLALR